MAKDKSTLLEAPQTDFEEQFGEMMGDLQSAIDKRMEKSFAALDEKTQASFKGAMTEIAKLRNDEEHLEAKWRKRFREMAEWQQAGGVSTGFFRNRAEKLFIGRMFIAAARNDPNRMKALYEERCKATGEELETASVTPVTGAKGGFLLREEVLGSILTHFPKYGIAEQLIGVRDVGSEKGGANLDKTEWDVFHPDFGVAPTEQDPNFEKVFYNLIHYSTLHIIENDMLEDELAISLADWMAMKISRAHARGLDRRTFIGDASKAMGKVLGIFKRTAAPNVFVTGVAGDDTFQELIDKTSYYLALVIGTLADWARDMNPSWIMHPTVFFQYLGVRDSTGAPLGNMLFNAAKPAFYLMGYPVNLSSVAHGMSDSGSGKVMAAFGAWFDAWKIYRHRKGLVVRYSDEYKFANQQTAVLSDMRQDICEVDPTGWVGLKTI